MTGGSRWTAVRAAADHRPGLSLCPTLWFAGDRPAVLGLLHMLQALKYAAPRYGGTFAAEIAANSNRRCVQLIGRTIQFMGRTRLLRLLVTIVIAVAKMTAS
jgi:hypothetical protein